MQHSIELMINILSHYQPALMVETSPSAAVMVIILEQDKLLLDNNTNNLSIVLTKRASTLPTYAGHYSFPGGMRDADDKDLYATAMRETQEELQLSCHAYQYLGQLDDFHDRYGHLVRPYVALMKKSTFLNLHKISLAEIQDIYFFPIAKLSELKDDPTLHAITKRKPSYSFTDGNVFVWGLTAAILVHLSNIILDENKPLGKKNA